MIYIPVFWLMFRFTEERARALVAAMQRLLVILAAVQLIFSAGF
jgi:hypothetical protein